METSVVRPFDRIVSALTYLTAGWVGIIVWVLFLLRKKTVSKFLRFNILQAVFLSLLFFAISVVLGFVAKILGIIPFVNYVVAQISLLLNYPMLFGRSLIQLIILVLFLYLMGYSLLGRYPRIYWVSKIVDYNAR